MTTVPPSTPLASLSRIGPVLAALRARGRVALIPYLTCGYPVEVPTPAVMHALVAGGADILELGVPFSDPMADGPVIQRACEGAVAAGVRLGDVLDTVRAFRQSNDHTPIVLMGYCNPVERFGIERFAQAAHEAGVDGVLMVDLPPEESAGYREAFDVAGLDPIYLLAPTSTEQRVDAVARQARGYIYYVSLKGVTGAGHIDTAEVGRMVPHLQARTGLPVGVGFGIRDAQTAQMIGALADAVVIGSRLIQVLEESAPAQAAQSAQQWLEPIRAALDALPSRAA